MATAAAPPPSAADVRPLVARRISNRGAWLFAGALGLSAIALFGALEARREARTEPGPLEGSATTGGAPITAPPALAIPQPYADNSQNPYGPYSNGQYPYGPPGAGGFTVPGMVPPGMNTPPVGSKVGGVPKAPTVPPPAYYDANSPDPPYVPPTVPATAPPPQAEDDAAPPTTGTSTSASLAGGRVSATRLANPSLTVPQGTVILAVLETALDSNRPGFVRAIVSRDVRSFDGTRVLIPRGSRLFGEYKADLAAGQNRAFVLWGKLTRPDGAQIAVNSPAADPLGRSGVKGKVNTHFFERFAGAILQSSLDVGVGLATRSATGGTVVLGLPGSTTQISPTGAESVKPTLKVPQGSSVSVFVARDLDFSTVE